MHSAEINSEQERYSFSADLFSEQKMKLLYTENKPEQCRYMLASEF